VAERERGRQALIEKIVHAQEEERRSISRELHDELGQSLLALLLAVQTQRTDGEGAAVQREDLEDRIRRMIDEVRRLAWGMHPSILDDYGLDSALSRHVQEVGSHSGLAVDYQGLDAPGRLRLPREVEVTLYRVAQEALTNAVRHARASQCSVVLLRDRAEVTLLIEDDGCGFDPEAVLRRQEGGLGLTGIRERVALLGGRCQIESSPAAGTRVRVQVPLREAAP
jgi:two-component system sensor histidine kinase UhpB